MHNIRLLFYLLMFQISIPVFSAEPDTLTRLLQQELQNNFKGLQQQDSLLYFMAYRMNDSSLATFKANKGGVLERSRSHSRFLDIESRVGSPQLDNTHKAVDNFYVNYPYGIRNLRIPLVNPEDKLREVLKFGSDYALRSARQKYSSILNDQSLRPNEKQTGMDFAPQKKTKQISRLETDALSMDSLKRFYGEIQQASKIFNNHSFILSSNISYTYTNVIERFVNTEGSIAVHKNTLSNLNIYVETVSKDGMVLWLDNNLYSSKSNTGIHRDSLLILCKSLIDRLDTLRKAPILEPFAGPVILKGAAAGVFIHEVFGHRVEGHRQKIPEEGQTFLAKIGQQVTAPFIDIMDNPRLKSHGGTMLNGHYLADNEGVAPVLASLIEKGIFKGFLQSRSVVSKGQVSNGHARGNLGKELTSRMGNTILKSKNKLTYDQLRARLKKILLKKKLKFGVIVEDISGGYTLTDRHSPQSFKLQPLYIKKVFADGRPDQVVRGVDAVGTPLNSLGAIVATGNDPVVFNGYCGAESGWVPVSTISPSLLLSSLEFESKTGNQEEQPYLKPPLLGAGP